MDTDKITKGKVPEEADRIVVQLLRNKELDEDDRMAVVALVAAVLTAGVLDNEVEFLKYLALSCSLIQQHTKKMCLEADSGKISHV